MGLKIGQKQGRDERKQEDYQTSAKNTQQMQGSLLGSFIPTLFLDFFQVHPYTCTCVCLKVQPLFSLFTYSLTENFLSQKRILQCVYTLQFVDIHEVILSIPEGKQLLLAIISKSVLHRNHIMHAIKHQKMKQIKGNVSANFISSTGREGNCIGLSTFEMNF